MKNKNIKVLITTLLCGLAFASINANAMKFSNQYNSNQYNQNYNKDMKIIKDSNNFKINSKNFKINSKNFKINNNRIPKNKNNSYPTKKDNFNMFQNQNKNQKIRYNNFPTKLNKPSYINYKNSNIRKERTHNNNNNINMFYNPSNSSKYKLKENYNRDEKNRKDKKLINYINKMLKENEKLKKECAELKKENNKLKQSRQLLLYKNKRDAIDKKPKKIETIEKKIMPIICGIVENCFLQENVNELAQKKHTGSIFGTMKKVMEKIENLKEREKEVLLAHSEIKPKYDEAKQKESFFEYDLKKLKNVLEDLNNYEKDIFKGEQEIEKMKKPMYSTKNNDEKYKQKIKNLKINEIKNLKINEENIVKNKEKIEKKIMPIIDGIVENYFPEKNINKLAQKKYTGSIPGTIKKVMDKIINLKEREKKVLLEYTEIKTKLNEEEIEKMSHIKETQNIYQNEGKEKIIKETELISEMNKEIIKFKKKIIELRKNLKKTAPEYNITKRKYDKIKENLDNLKDETKQKESFLKIEKMYRIKETQDIYLNGRQEKNIKETGLIPEINKKIRKLRKNQKKTASEHNINKRKYDKIKENRDNLKDETKQKESFLEYDLTELENVFKKLQDYEEDIVENEQKIEEMKEQMITVQQNIEKMYSIKENKQKNKNSTSKPRSGKSGKNGK